MKLTHYIYILLGTAATLASCQSDDVLAPHYTVGETINEIRLMAGVGESHGADVTRANITAESHHARHKNFTAGTAMRVRVDGTWLGHSPATLQPVTTATISSTKTGTDNTHNEVAFADGQKLFWDDFGTADPANKSPQDGNGREKGLTIYGVAVDGVTTAPDVANIATWSALPWELAANQTSGWAAKDLLTSNNIQAKREDVIYATDGTLKFDDLYPTLTAEASNLMEFTHAMTKITVVLTAGEGFPGYVSSPSAPKFESNPTVTLLGFNYTGTVNVIDKVSTATATTPTIQMHLADGGQNNKTATFEALVFPGNSFENSTNILQFNADGNIYSVTAANLNTAIQTAITKASTTKYPGTDNTLLQAWNYKLIITVNKTEIKVTATIADWKEVEAETEKPLIDVTEAYGHPTQSGHPAFTESFDLYRSTAVNGSYLGVGDHAVVSYSSSAYSLTPQLYWPNHNTHYFFRGVWPLVGSTDGPISSQVTANAIDISNTIYKKNSYPSDLMVGAPLLTDDKTLDETCKVHTSPATQGICATEGKVHINFRYMMSQVEVRLSTNTAVGATDAVNLTNAKVEIVNGYTQGKVALGSISVTDLSTVTDFTLGHVDGEDDNYRHSAIVPQPLTYSTPGAATNLRFRITIYKNGDLAQGIDDIYYTDIQPILKKESTTEKVAPNGKWESGTHYIYNLDIRKTELKVTATIKDWVTVAAEEDIWF